jgi:hypothetical protein
MDQQYSPASPTKGIDSFCQETPAAKDETTSR